MSACFGVGIGIGVGFAIDFQKTPTAISIPIPIPIPKKISGLAASRPYHAGHAKQFQKLCGIGQPDHLRALAADRIICAL